MLAIKIQQLEKTYSDGTQALKGIDLEVEMGDFCALLGANGAGKTTIIGVLTGLVVKTGGTASVFGYDVVKQSEMARNAMGVVPQEMNFNMFEKIQDIVVNQAGYYGIRRSVALKESAEILKQLGLWEKRNTPSRSLSGGMKRRLMIARALINKPKLLILDEPTAGVDVELRHTMWEFLNEINKQGTTILLTTHYLEEVEQMCRNAAIIKDGKIIAFDSVKKLVKLLDKETYVAHTASVVKIDEMKQYNAKVIDEHSFEFEVKKDENLHVVMEKMVSLKMDVIDLRPKSNRMEKLFLHVLNNESDQK